MQDAAGTLTPLVTEKSEKFPYDEKLKKMPVVLLQDKGSASASEVMSAALKDLKRGYIIGRRVSEKERFKKHWTCQTVEK